MTSLVSGCFAASGTGRLVKIDGIMNKEKYVDLLDHNLKQSARDLSLGRCWSFVQDNNPKHTAKFTKKCLTYNKIDVLEWPSQCPDFNLNENLWRLLKVVMKREPKGRGGHVHNASGCGSEVYLGAEVRVTQQVEPSVISVCFCEAGRQDMCVVPLE